MTLSIQDKNILCQQYLTSLYQHAPSQQTNSKPLPVTETYGELLYAGVQEILSQLTLRDTDIFMDLGSGLGKAVIQVFLMSAVKAAYGIEISPALFQQASTAANRVHDELPEFFVNNRKLAFFQGDFFKIPFSMASVVFVASQCFGPNFLDALGKQLDATPSIHTVLSLRPLLALNRLVFQRAFRIDCSWDSALCYIYTKE